MMCPVLRSFALAFVTQKFHEGAQQLFSLNAIETGQFGIFFIRPPLDSGTASIDRRCFSVHRERNIFQCFRCKPSGRMLDLRSHYRGVTIHAAALEIHEHLRSTPAGTVSYPDCSS
jgi:hypothetical protein